MNVIILANMIPKPESSKGHNLSFFLMSSLISDLLLMHLIKNAEKPLN